MEHISNKYDARIFIQKTQNTGKRRVCALTRVSTQHEQQTHALDNQNQWIADEIGRHSDWLFDANTDLYTDNGISGTSTKKRVDFNNMIAKAKAGEYDLIVTREVCRFMRNAKLTLTLVDELEKCGVEVYFVNDGIWSFNKDDYFKLTIMATYAEQESRKVSERVFSGQAVARANGVHFGKGNILGYDIAVGEKSYQTTYIINEEQAKIVRIMFDMALAGHGMKKIKLFLEDNGYKTAEGKSVWHVSTIERTLRRRTYMGEYEYMQSVTIDPLTHERINQNDKTRRICKKGNFEPIIQPDIWFKVQDCIDSRINRNLVKNDNPAKGTKGVINKDIYCQKMRCGCGRRFKKDLGRQDNTGTYRCYAVVDDGSQKKRQERSLLLDDDCSVNGIIDWKLDLFTLNVFKHLSFNANQIQTDLCEIIDKCFVESKHLGYSEEDKLRVEVEVKKLQNKVDKLLDYLTDELITKEEYKAKREKLNSQINEKMLKLAELNKVQTVSDEKEKTLLKVREFAKSKLTFPKVKDTVMAIPEEFINSYVNSIKACANNVFEYNIRINPDAKVVSPLVVPDDEYNPVLHSASKIMDNSNAILIGEFTVDYDTAKAYANKMKRKAVRVHWKVPATVRIYANII